MLSAKLGAAYGAFDRAGLWDCDGATSMTAWLVDRTRMTRGDATRTLASARRLAGLPLTSAAARDGSLSGGQVKVIVANVTEASAELFARHEEAVVPELVASTMVQTTSTMRWWARRAESLLDDPEPGPEPESKVSLSATLRGRWRLDGDLGPLAGEVLDTALRLAERPYDPSDGEVPPSASQRRAESLDALCRFFLEHHDHPPATRHRPHVNVIVTLEDLVGGQGGEFPDGVTIDAASLASLVCDSTLHRVVMAGRSAVLDYELGTRSISTSLYHALVVRDRHCRFPGCDRRASWCECHHPPTHPAVADGGPTRASNLVLVCSRHHHRLHQPGWRAILTTEAELVVTDPGGRVRTSHPPGQGPRPPPELFAA